MLQLQELFDDLAFGEFANMAVGQGPSGAIPHDRFPRVVSLVNAGLRALYTKFPLKEKEFPFHQRAGKSIFYLRAEHIGDPTAGDPEIYLDNRTDDPIANDMIKITAAYDDLGNQIHINKAQFTGDLFMPAQDTIRVNPIDVERILDLTYQATYPKIAVSSGFDPEKVTLHIPDFIRPALLAHIASKWFVGKKSQAAEGQPNLTSTFMFRYEAECLLITNEGLVSEFEEAPNRFENQGWR